MSLVEQKRSYLFERLGILFSFSIYLLIFNVNLPHGDALRIVRQIESADLAWNPNHLLLDPFGYYWYDLVSRLGSDITPLGSFEIISFITTIISLLLFHSILVAAGIKGWIVRVAAVVALFASKSFISLAVTQYYFMLQMPFLLGAMLCGIRFISGKNSEAYSVKYLHISGVLLAIATGIEVNNVLLIFFLGIVIGINYSTKITWDWRRTAHIWGAAAIIGFPMFLAGYFASQQGTGFLTWLLSYAGANNDAMEEMYGMQWSLQGIAVSGARVIYNLLFGNIIETAGLGTILKSISFGETLEFLPAIPKIVLAFILMPIVAVSQAGLLVWSVRRIKQNSLYLYLLSWISAYLLFAFFWNNGSNIFWFQTLPAIMLLFCFYAITTREKINKSSSVKTLPWQLWLLAISIPFLLIVNTLQTVIPVSFTDINKYEKEYAGMLQRGDLVIVPGWDKYKWMSVYSAEKDIQMIMLMNMAVKAKVDNQYIGNLVNIVRGHLKNGNRVVIARLYDLDSELRPWNGLADMGWPRTNVQALLKNFCNKKLITIDDVVFRELYECAADKKLMHLP